MKKDIFRFLKKHGGMVFALLASGGVVATAVLTAKAAPKVKEKLIEAEREKEEPLTVADKVKVAAPHYILPISVCATTIGCIIGGYIFDRKQQKSLIGAYAMLSKTFTNYKGKLIELYGIETHDNILKAIAAEEANPKPISGGSWLRGASLDVGIDEDKRLFYDVYSQTYFESTYSAVLQAQYHLNRNMMVDGWCPFVPLSMWYDFLGIEDKTGKGDEVGWMIIEGVYWIDFDNRLVELEDGLQCIFIEMLFEPQPEEVLENYC